MNPQEEEFETDYGDSLAFGLRSDIIEDIPSTGGIMTFTVAQVRSKDLRHIRGEDDIVAARLMAKRVTTLLAFSLLNQTKVVTATSEIARNTLDYGGGGTLTVEVVESSTSTGIRLTFQDDGPGIADMEAAMRDGYTGGSGMGLGLGGSKRLMDEFEITSEPGKGTRVCMTKWG